MSYQNEKDPKNAVADFNKNASNVPSTHDPKTTGAPMGNDPKGGVPAPKDEYGK